MRIRSRMSTSIDGYVTVSADTGLTLGRSRELPGGSIEIVYDVGGRTNGSAARDAAWAPESRRR
jgi:hypothetical protein